MQTILMQPNEVPLGTVVLPCAPGKKRGDSRAPLILLAGGVPIRRKWYPCDLDGNNLSAGFEFDAMRKGVRFVPAKAYSPIDAPLNSEFAVFIDSKRITYEKYPRSNVEVTKLPDGTFMSVCGYAYDHWLRRYSLPKNAGLVAHATCKRDKTIDDAVILPPTWEGSDVWKMLKAIGASRMMGTARLEGPEFWHVWLPSGWKLMSKMSTHTNMRQEVLVDDTGVERAIATWVTLGWKKGGDIKLV